MRLPNIPKVGDLMVMGGEDVPVMGIWVQEWEYAAGPIESRLGKSVDAEKMVYELPSGGYAGAEILRTRASDGFPAVRRLAWADHLYGDGEEH